MRIFALGVICFYSGTVCLAVLLLTFIWLQESYWIGVLISLIAVFSLIPTLLILIFAGGPGGSADSEVHADKESGNSERKPLLLAPKATLPFSQP